MFPRDTVQVARLSFQLAVREAYLDQPTLTLPPATNPLELRVTRMPPGFDALSLRLEGEWSPVRLLLQEQMPLRFVGQAEVRFRTVEARDAAFASLLTMRVQHGAAFGRDDFYFVSAMTALTEEIRLDGCEISECRWLPLAEYRADTEATAAERGIGDTMNSWLMRNVEASLNAGSPPAEWGWKAFELDAGAAQSSANVTGWGNRPTYHIFGPPSFQPGRPMPVDD